MAGNAKQFRAQLMAFTDHVKKKHVNLVTRVARAAHTTAFQMTPIDTSRAMSGWVSQLNSPFMGEPKYVPGFQGSTLGEAVAINLNNIKEVHGAYRFGDKWIIRNNVPYIELLEDGHSRTQAPAGMMSFAIQAAVREMKR
jgi:hypothetical protein